MIDVEPLIEESFSRLYPTAAVTPDWAGVLARAGVTAPRVGPSESRRGPGQALFAGRRRLFAVAAVGLAALLIPLIAIGATEGWWFTRVPDTPTPEGAIVVVKTGSWGGVPWALTAYRSGGNVCFGLTPNWQANEGGTGAAMECGVPVRGLAQKSQTYPELHSVGYLASGGEKSFPGWVAGPTAPDVAEVDVVLQSGETIRTSPFAAPAELGLKVDFYAAQFPCGDEVRALIPKDAAGRPLEHWVLPNFSHPGEVACAGGS